MSSKAEHPISQYYGIAQHCTRVAYIILMWRWVCWDGNHLHLCNMGYTIIESLHFGLSNPPYPLFAERDVSICHIEMPHPSSCKKWAHHRCLVWYSVEECFTVSYSVIRKGYATCLFGMWDAVSHRYWVERWGCQIHRLLFCRRETCQLWYSLRNWA